MKTEYINTVGQWIYYVSDKGICRTKIDGSETEIVRDREVDKSWFNKKLIDDNIDSEYEAPDWTGDIYYFDMNVVNDKILYQMGGHVRLPLYVVEADLNDGTVSKSNIRYYDRFYGIAYGDNSKFYWDRDALSRSKKNGKRESISRTAFGDLDSIAVYEDDIYYVEYNVENSSLSDIYVLYEGKSESKLLLNGYGEDRKLLGVNEDYIVFVEGNSIYKVDKDGWNKVLLYGDISGNNDDVFMMDDAVYVMNFTTNNPVRKIIYLDGVEEVSAGSNEESEEDSQEESEEATISFSDAHFEKAIRQIINKPEGDIYS